MKYDIPFDLPSILKSKLLFLLSHFLKLSNDCAQELFVRVAIACWKNGHPKNCLFVTFGSKMFRSYRNVTVAEEGL